MRRVISFAALFVTLAAFGVASPAGAQQDQARTFRADLAPLNDSGAAGQTTIVAHQDGTVTVSLQTRGVSPNLPHAQHIHIGGSNECPPPTAAGDDEFLTTAEGAPFYGGVQVSLTTDGAVDAGSALAVERFPVATNGGTVNYERTFALPEGVTVEDVANGVIVQHGISTLFDDPAQYDGDMQSSLDPALPLEATIPTVCGKLVAANQQGAARAADAPRGGVAAGFGGTAGDESLRPFTVAAAVALIGAVLTALVGSRRLRSDLS